MGWNKLQNRLKIHQRMSYFVFGVNIFFVGGGGGGLKLNFHMKYIIGYKLCTIHL